MSLKTDIRPITYLKSHAADLINQINTTHRHVIITQNGVPKGVLQDPTSFEEMRSALTIMKMISQSEEAISIKNVFSSEDVFSDLENRLKSP